MAGDLSLVFDFIETPRHEIGRQQKFNTLRNMAFFAPFTDTEIWELINAGIWQTVPAAENIILEGEIDKSFYVIIEGEVVVSKTGKYLDHLEQGDCFGEMGFISGQKRSATIKAKTDVTILKIHAPLIERASINCQLRFHKLFLNTMIERLCRATNKIVSD
jgi:CRP-like cAMP-binding protein